MGTAMEKKNETTERLFSLESICPTLGSISKGKISADQRDVTMLRVLFTKAEIQSPRTHGWIKESRDNEVCVCACARAYMRASMWMHMCVTELHTIVHMLVCSDLYKH